MSGMSSNRAAWMVAVHRARVRQHGLLNPAPLEAKAVSVSGATVSAPGESPAVTLAECRCVGEVRTPPYPSGIAVSAVLGILAVSSWEGVVSLFTMSPSGGFVPKAVLGNEDGGSTGSMLEFDCGAGDKLAFTVPADSHARPTLLVAESRNHRVQEVDVISCTWVGYLYPPGAIRGPCGLAATARYIAVSTVQQADSGDDSEELPVESWLSEEDNDFVEEGVVDRWPAHAASAAPGPGAGGSGADHSVHLFDAVTRCHLWHVDGAPGPGGYLPQFDTPLGVRIVSGGAHVAVADHNNQRIVVLSAADGSAVAHTPLPVRPWDVEECAGGWLVCGCGEDGRRFAVVAVDAAGAGHDALGGTHPRWHGSAMVLVPRVGLVVADRRRHRVHWQVSGRVLCDQRSREIGC
jgi:hypothetical protein